MSGSIKQILIFQYQVHVSPITTECEKIWQGTIELGSKSIISWNFFSENKTNCFIGLRKLLDV